MRTVFLGTPEAAVPVLEALAGISDVLAVVTQPDRPRGRSGTPAPPPVKVRAGELGLSVVQPDSDRALAGILESHAPVDVAVLAAFGMLVRPDALDVPTHGIVNVHYSLLPRWRGAAPVHRAILEGDTRTGVTLIRLDEGLDTGPVLASRSTAIGPEETTGSLTRRLARSGADLLASRLPSIVAGAVLEVAQDPERVTIAAKIDRDERWIDPGAGAARFLRHVRAMTPAPGSWAHHDSGRFGIRSATMATTGTPLEVGALVFEEGRLLLGVADGAVELREVQPEGKRTMPGPDWARGRGGDLGTLR